MAITPASSIINALTHVGTRRTRPARRKIPVQSAAVRSRSLLRACLSDRAIALIVKRRAAAAGTDPANFSAHSLRAACATEAAAHGVEERGIGRHTRHRSIAVLRGYIREGTVFMHNASARLGL